MPPESEAMTYIKQIRSMLEFTMNDAAMDAQLCEDAKAKIDDAFTAMDLACSAQGREENPTGQTRRDD